MKKKLSVLLVLLLLLLTAAPHVSASTHPETLTCVPEISHFIQEPDPAGELHIAPAVLKTADGEREVWFVTVRGIDWLMRGVNHFFTYLLVSFNSNNKYLQLAKTKILEHVPEGAALVLAGHSLGGMVVQQLICAEEITSRYEVLNAVTFGSPYVMVDASRREGRLVRLEDRYDTVPKFSIAALLDRANYNGGIKMNSSYLGDPSGAHNVSYKRMDIWGDFDALGTRGGTAKLQLNYAEMITVKA